MPNRGAQPDHVVGRLFSAPVEALIRLSEVLLMTTYDENLNSAEARLKPLLTDEFLATLALAVRACGWSVDHVESTSFVEWCFDVAEKDRPDLSAFKHAD